ncbi:MAG TPA: hypothetical protein VGH15_04345 [Caulobacteraceae bacterium]|jgi:hypothetical protein
MKLAIAAAFAALTLAGSAFADTRLTATLDSPQGAPSKFIAAHAVWNCEGATCVAQVAPDESFGATSCKELAKRLGHVASYASDTKSLDNKALEKCNTGAAAPAAIGTASR